MIEFLAAVGIFTAYSIVVTFAIFGIGCLMVGIWPFSRSH